MILKGSQRKNGSDLAVHLMNSFDNSQVEIAEVYGTVAGDLLGAFAEFEAVSLGTKAENYLYSLSINPPQPLTREQYHEAIQEIEDGLGLTDQARAIVFHVKDGREHAHVVWSRIDVEQMKAIHMSHDHSRLMDLSIALARKFSFDLTQGQLAWEEKQKFEKDKLEPTLAEKSQAEATGLTPDERRAEITAAYEQSDTAEAFRIALEQKGYVLARGDRRNFVVVDDAVNVHSLTRYIKGYKAKDIKSKLAALDVTQLPNVEQAKDLIRQHREAQHDKREDRQRELAEQRRKLKEQALAAKHAKQREKLANGEQELRRRHDQEAQALKAAQETERGDIVFRVRSAVTDLIAKTPGMRSVLSHIQKMTHLDPRERHVLEGDALSSRHERERLDFKRQERAQSLLETRELQSLEKTLRKEERLVLSLEGKAKHDFTDAARDRQQQKTNMEDGELSAAFNDAGEFVEGAHREGEEGRGHHKSGWKKRTDELQKGRKLDRGRGYTYDPKDGE